MDDYHITNLRASAHPVNDHALLQALSALQATRQELRMLCAAVTALRASSDLTDGSGHYLIAADAKHRSEVISYAQQLQQRL